MLQEVHRKIMKSKLMLLQQVWNPWSVFPSVCVVHELSKNPSQVIIENLGAATQHLHCRASNLPLNVDYYKKCFCGQPCACLPILYKYLLRILTVSEISASVNVCAL